MRFTGQVKIPDLDYPGVPASVRVDGKQVELFVDGESLGRWSLVDVRAERLISSAFSLKLDGEEVTFIADQPTDFAYGGVEAMANVWATHKSMRLPRRLVANSRSRQGTKPSRIPDLREAIEETLAGSARTALAPARAPDTKEVSGIASLREATGRRTPDIETAVAAEPETPLEDRAETAGPQKERITDRTADVIPADVVHEDSEEAPVQSDAAPDSVDTPDAVLAEPETEPAPQPPATDSVFKESVPWAKSVEAETEDPPEEPAPPPAGPESRDQLIAESPVLDESVGAAEPEEAIEPEQDAKPAATQSGSVPWMTPPLPDDAPGEPAGVSPEPRSGDSDAVEPERDPEYVVDLGAFEDRRDADGEPIPVAADDDEEASRPMATAGARGGIMGAVRSAFVRNRVEHTHAYVEAPGGLGIKRQICAECGHISIGVE